MSSNTRFPSKYICLFRKLPRMTLQHLRQIAMLTPRLKDMTIDLEQDQLRVEIWKKEPRKRKRGGCSFGTETHAWELGDTVQDEDVPMVRDLLDRVQNMQECQFHTSVLSKPPDAYQVNVTPTDTFSYNEFVKLKHEYRSFVREVAFDFPKHTMHVHVQRVTADLPCTTAKRRKLLRTSV